jgi:hypothetical protein
MSIEKDIDRRLKDLYRSLLNGDDDMFFVLRRWFSRLIETPEIMDGLPEDLQQRMRDCLERYKIENRYPADGRYPGRQWPYLYYLAEKKHDQDLQVNSTRQEVAG